GPEKAWVKYEIDSEGLRLALFDGGRGRPESFEWSGQKDPMLMVLRLVALRGGAAPAHVAKAAPPPPARPTDPEAMDQRKALLGRWRVVSVLKNGKPTEDPDISGSLWNFQVPALTVQNAKGSMRAFAFGIENGCLVMSGDQNEIWSKYEIDGEGLRIA